MSTPLTVSAPLCSWLLAACYTRTMAGISGMEQQPGANAGLTGRVSSSRRSGRRSARSRSAAMLHQRIVAAAGTMGSSMVACLSFEACPHYRNAKWSSFLWEEEARILGSPQRKRASKTRCAAAITDRLVAPEKDAGEESRSSTSVRDRRVVITGMGLVSSLGNDPDTFYDNLLEGNSGISEIQNFDCQEFPTRIAGEIKDFSADGWVAPKFSRRMDKFMLYLLTAGKKAVANAGIAGDGSVELDKSKCGVLMGSAMGGMQVFNDAIEALRVSYRKMNPFCVPFATTNMGSAMLAMDLGWMGPNYAISTACATSNSCILSAANHIIRGEADVMVSGGSDAAIIPIGLGGFVACRALSQRNDDPSKASRPWDRDRDGFVLGEGAGALVLEELEHAKRRGAEIYAEFLGGSLTCDAYHVTAAHPEGTGMLLCIEKALDQSGVRRDDVNYVNAHAASTRSGDVQEYKAIMQSLGDNTELRVNSTKSMMGHLLGAAGAVDAIATIQAIKTGWLHPTINIENPEKDVNMDYIVGSQKQRFDVKVALSNSFGFGGHNSSILFAPYQDERSDN
ncbi:3-oxoacyl-[acyl-carrier-protein] synthase II, chloroplastic [Selaginella moellendorffii]|nr:3-oxoacyl-[acyl-carrier-protein] synthase II, chloroplastic [Selaginella moellendorffii]XP_002989269.2 3-oxoacyl-[acyl-carrier-protein] synthase II, chloroplastic [Selaginella moellendorffii]|eukprot:XP_002965643.2 3-oxoacyl-[acyl-carrier-protein] synthase II, chloroplastic [Selaginella moellendorffii]